MSAVVYALDAVGRSAEGERLLGSFVTSYRRDRFPLPSELAVRYAPTPVGAASTIAFDVRHFEERAELIGLARIRIE